METPLDIGTVTNILDLIAGQPPVEVRYAVRILRYAGQPEHALSVNIVRTTHRDEKTSEAVCIVCPDNARGLAMHLLNAAEVVHAVSQDQSVGLSGVRPLPTICLCGREFYVDERLRQLRSVSDPYHWFDLDPPGE